MTDCRQTEVIAVHGQRESQSYCYEGIDQNKSSNI